MSEFRLAPERHVEWAKENYSVVLDTPVELLATEVDDCPGWQIDTIADHFARGAVVFRTFMSASPEESPLAGVLSNLPPRAHGVEALELARAETSALFAVVEALDPETPCPYVLGGPATVATWLWHMAAETWIHRADAEQALGRAPSLQPDRGVDCLQWSARFREAAASPLDEAPAGVRCVATDAGSSVIVGAAPVGAEVSGAASDLSLRLWNRRHGPLDGDGPAVDAWADIALISPLD